MIVEGRVFDVREWMDLDADLIYRATEMKMRMAGGGLI
jgi:hypothetical protein